jgi:flagellar protein FlaG
MSINLQVNHGVIIEKNDSLSVNIKYDELKIKEKVKSETVVNTKQKIEKSDDKKIKEEDLLIVKLDNAKEEQKLKDAMSIISDFLNIPVRSVNFAEHEGSNKTVIKIFDTENQELIKQFPSDEILSIAQRIAELQQDVGSKTGILLDENV